MTTLDDLEALAKEATPGPWFRLFGERTVYDRMKDGCRGVAIVRTDQHPPNGKEINNLNFIAASNPATILALIKLCKMQHSALKADPDLREGMTKDALAGFESFGKE